MNVSGVWTVLLEFQSTVDSRMALRMLDYTTATERANRST